MKRFAFAVIGCALTATIFGAHIVGYGAGGLHEGLHCWVNRYVQHQQGICIVEMQGGDGRLSDGSTDFAWTHSRVPLLPWEHPAIFAFEVFSVISFAIPGSLLCIPWLILLARRRRQTGGIEDRMPA